MFSINSTGLKTSNLIFDSLIDVFYLIQGYRFTPKHIQLTNVARSTNILGLYPGSLYNVTIVAESKSGKGPGISALFWTEVGGTHSRQ